MDVNELELPEPKGDSAIAQFLYINQLDFSERILFDLALCIHIDPDLLRTTHLIQNQEINAFGVLQGKNFKGAIPSGLTWLFIVAGKDIEKRLSVLSNLKNNRILAREIVRIESGFAAEPFLNGPLVFNENLLYKIFTNTHLEIELDREATSY